MAEAPKAAQTAANMAPATALPSVTGYPQRFCPRDAARRQAQQLTPRTGSASASPATRPDMYNDHRHAAPFPQMVFRDGLIDRLSGTKKLTFLSLLKTSDSDVFLGVTRSGVVGLHVDMRNVLPTSAN